MRGLYIPDLEIPENCMGCNYRDPSYGNCCELMIDNPSDSFEEQYRLCPIRILCKNAVPAADVRPVVRGKWVADGDGYHWTYNCSVCGWKDGYPFNERHNYCPNCGAMMEES